MTLSIAKEARWKIDVENVGSVHGDIQLQFPGHQGGYPKSYGLTVRQAMHLHRELTKALIKLRSEIMECKPLPEENEA